MDCVTVTRATPFVPRGTLGACDRPFWSLAFVFLPQYALYDSCMTPYCLPNQPVPYQSRGIYEIDVQSAPHPG